MKLSVSEIACLRWAAEGKSFQHIAMLEGWPVEKIGAHIASALTKLRALALRDAVDKAVILGLI